MGAMEISESSSLKAKVNDTTTAVAVQSILENSLQENKTSALKELHQQIPTSKALSEITSNLILTSATFVNAQAIEQTPISCIISCAPELPDPPLRDNSVVYCKLDVLDNASTKIFRYFDSTADLIQQICNFGGKILVFCVAGVSRSATICIAYLMKHKKMSLLDAYNFVKSSRPRIKPNCEFFKQLIDYEKVLFGYNSVQMVYNETVQMEIPDVYEIWYKTPISSRERRQTRCRN